jgi:hypothetical protein
VSEEGRLTKTVVERLAGDTDRRPPTEPVSVAARRGDWWQPLGLSASIAAVLFGVVGFSDANLHKAPLPPSVFFAGPPWLAGWIRWDSGWYGMIANRGYWYLPGRQSPVAFFPGYPAAMRAGGWLVGNVFLAGILITLVCGIGFAVLLHRWLAERLPPGAAWTALLVVLLYPYAFFLFGAVYADALFLVCALAAFVLVESGHPLVAGLAGAVATATRPVGAALVVGLWLVARRRDRSTKGVVGAAHDAFPALLSTLGLGAHCAYLWVRFGHPFLFVTAEGAWEQTPGPKTWFKLAYVHYLSTPATTFHYATYLAPPLLTMATLALVPRVTRRFGSAYGVYSLLAIGIPAVGSKDFFGMGRYLLAAFPCFAVAGEMLATKPRLRLAVLAASATGLVLLTSAFARGHYVS